MQRARGGVTARRILGPMSADANRSPTTIPGFQALLDALGVSVVEGKVMVPFDIGSGSQDVEIAAVGWATVELDRAEADLGAELATTFETRQPRCAPRGRRSAAQPARNPWS